jgi:hypothetical protein
MDGKLWVESEKEGNQTGAKFYFSIPYDKELFDEKN